MISNIVRIPASLLHDRVIPLLEISDLVQLDSAVLNHNTRLLFLDLLRGARLMTETLQMGNRMAKWMLNRYISVSALCVSEKATDLSIVKQLAEASVVTHISFDHCNMVTSAAVIDILQGYKMTKFLRLSSFNHANVVLSSITGSLTALTTIDLSENETVDIDQLAALTISCKRLTEIHANNCENWINDACSGVIAVNCPDLKKLSLDNCSQCGDGTLQVLAQHCHDLRYLSLREIQMLTDGGVRALAGGCAELRTILVDESHLITSDGISTLAQGCTKLEEIGLPSCDEHLHLAVAALVQHCPALNTLHCSSPHFTDKSLLHLRNCPLLHTLELGNARIASCAVIPLLNSCKHLRRLIQVRRCVPSVVPTSPVFSGKEGTVCRLQHVSFVFCPSLTDAEFILLIAQCPHITELNLQHCERITDAAMLATAFHCRKLENVKFSRMSLSDAALCAIVESCPNLHSIDIASNMFLTDAAVSAIAQHCPYLRYLNMSYCTKVTDVGIVEILQKCQKLREIVLYFCHPITSKVLDAAVLHGTHLRKLDIGSCPKVRACAVTMFQNARPNCELLC